MGALVSSPDLTKSHTKLNCYSASF